MYPDSAAGATDKHDPIYDVIMFIKDSHSNDDNKVGGKSYELTELSWLEPSPTIIRVH